MSLEATPCCENSIICMSSPWAELKPVRRRRRPRPRPGGACGPSPGVEFTRSVPGKQRADAVGPKASARSSAASRASASARQAPERRLVRHREPRTSTQSQGMIDGCARKWALRFFFKRV